MDHENIIHCYSRAQAIADGVLVDVTDIAEKAGFSYPIALTRAVWGTCVEVPTGVEDSEEGRLCGILVMLRSAIWRSRRRGHGVNPILFQLQVRNDNRHGTPSLVELKAVCGQNDDGTPCITIMEPCED